MVNPVIVRVVADVTGFNRGMEEARRELTKMRVLTMTLHSAMQGLKTVLFAGAASTAAMVIPTLLATNAVKDYDTAMRRFLSVTGSKTTAETLDKVNAAFNKLSITYGESAANVAQMAVEFGKAGFTVDEILKNLLEPSLKLAVANTMDSATAAEIATFAWQLWGKEVGSFSKMANMMHVAANESILDVEDLAEAFQYVGSAAVINNVTFAEFLSIAGAVSQIAAKAGESFRSLFINMLLRGEELADALNAPQIIENGRVSLSKLIEVLREGNFTLEEWNAAMDLWGLRPATNLNQLRLTATEFERIMKALNTDTNALSNSTEILNLSFDRLLSKITETALSGLRNRDVMETLRFSLTTISETMKASNFTAALKEMIRASTEFIVNQGKELIHTLIDLLNLLKDAMPTLRNLSQIFLFFAKSVSKAGVEVIVFLAVLWQMIKLAPSYINALIALGVQTDVAVKRLVMLGASVSLISTGLTMFITSSDPLIRTLGAISVAVGVAAAAFTALSIAKDAAIQNYGGIAILLASLGMGAVALGALLSVPSSTYKPTPVTPTAPIPEYAPVVNNNTNANRTVNVYGDVNIEMPANSNIKRELDSIGGWYG